MRDYSKASPTFWTGETGRQIRAIVAKDLRLGRDVQVTAFYLFTCPSSNWIGLYYLPFPTLCHEIGISREAGVKALQTLEEIDFAYYDMEGELVWLPGAAKFQIAGSLKPGDNRIIGIVKSLQQHAKHWFARDFYDRYAGLYHLPEMGLPDLPDKALGRPFGGPPKPVTETEAGTGTGAEAKSIHASSDEKPSLSAQPPVPVFLKIPLIDKTEYKLLQRQVDEWKGLYLAVDVEQECRNYLGWAIANPKRRKTRRGILTSITFWLEDKQNKGGRKNGSNSGAADNRGNSGQSGLEFDPDKLPEYAKKK